jgi:hypothetical protein
MRACIEGEPTIDRAALQQILEAVAAGSLSPRDAQEQLRSLPYEDIGFAKIDHHRALRDGLPEVILATGKTPAECATLAERIARQSDRLLITRVDEAQTCAVLHAVPDAFHHERARCITWWRQRLPGRPGLLVCSGGTADLPVAEEAAITAEMMGCAPARLFDVGVAGLPRLLDRVQDLQRATAIVAVAGMDAALPSVIAGLTAAPVIAAPTSVGYGASFDGLAALLAMLNACAPGVAVVNIDNGFGAGYLAASIIRGAGAAREAGP